MRRWAAAARAATATADVGAVAIGSIRSAGAGWGLRRTKSHSTQRVSRWSLTANRYSNRLEEQIGQVGTRDCFAGALSIRGALAFLANVDSRKFPRNPCAATGAARSPWLRMGSDRVASQAPNRGIRASVVRRGHYGEGVALSLIHI